jgi:hypothetical protein
MGRDPGFANSDEWIIETYELYNIRYGLIKAARDHKHK